MKNATRILLTLLATNYLAWCMALPNTWTQKASFIGNARYGNSTFSVGAKGYYFAGATFGFTVMNDLWEYDPSANAWSQMASLPGATRLYATSFSIGSYGYVGMGRDNLNSSVLQDFWRYDPSTNTWIGRAPFGGGTRSGATGFTIGSLGYVACGHSGITAPTGNRDDLWEYDPGTNTWTQRANFPGVPRQGPLGFGIGTTAYVGQGNNGGSLYDLYAYDQSSDTWSSPLGNVPFYFGDGGHTIGSVAYVVAGGATWQYSPLTDTWTARANYAGTGTATGPTTFSIGTKLYGGGGFTPGNTLAVDFWEYDPIDCQGNIGGNALPGSSCFDGNLCTVNDVWSNACVCAGTYQDTDGDGICDAIDNCPTTYGQMGDACNDGNFCTVNDVIDGTCTCAGTFQDTDGDGICDAIDSCPNLYGQMGDACNDGNFCTVNDVIDGTCTCAGTFQDTDGDGICDAIDSCPNLYGQMGDACNDGNFCTVNDVIDGTCTCAGTFQDTDGDGVCDAIDSCPNLYGQIGDACNDGNPNTINDAINGSCVCAGTPCPNPVTLTLMTDGNAAQTSWNIVNGGTNTVVCSGSGYPNNNSSVANCCLPNGCYDLQVFDSGGDGINLGGFVLRDVGSQRIIDNVSNGANFSSLSKVTSVSNVPVSFCVPIGTDAMTFASCDLTGLTINSVVQAQVNAGVSAQYGINDANSGYQFWVFHPHGGYSRRIFFSHAAPGTGWPGPAPVAERCSYFKLSAMSSSPTIPQNVLLNIRVRSRVNGVYAEFGPACRLTIGTAPNCSTTQLTATATPLISCGATGLNRVTGVLWSNNVPGANKYQFEFVNASTLVFLRNIASPTRNLNMSTWGGMVALPNCFTPYNIRVRVSFNGGATYCPWGPVCQVTFNCPPEQGRELEDLIMQPATALSIWPNPNRGDQLHLSIDQLDERVTTATVELVDVFGKTVMSARVPTDDGRSNTVLQLAPSVAAGLYMVNVTAGDRVLSQRLVVER